MPFLFQIARCYELAIFFLVVPFTIDNLHEFKREWESNHETRAEYPKRVALDNSKWWARERHDPCSCC